MFLSTYIQDSTSHVSGSWFSEFWFLESWVLGFWFLGSWSRVVGLCLIFWKTMEMAESSRSLSFGEKKAKSSKLAEAATYKTNLNLKGKKILLITTLPNDVSWQETRLKLFITLISCNIIKRPVFLLNMKFGRYYCCENTNF